MIGRRMYEMTATRPNIAYTIGVLSRYNHDPSNEHIVALESVFRYVNGTKHRHLRFGGALGVPLGEPLGGALAGALGGALGGEEEGALGCYVDSDYTGCTGRLEINKWNGGHI